MSVFGFFPCPLTTSSASLWAGYHVCLTLVWQRLPSGYVVSDGCCHNTLRRWVMLGVGVGAMTPADHAAVSSMLCLDEISTWRYAVLALLESIIIVLYLALSWRCPCGGGLVDAASRGANTALRIVQLLMQWPICFRLRFYGWHYQRSESLTYFLSIRTDSVLSACVTQRGLLSIKCC